MIKRTLRRWLGIADIDEEEITRRKFIGNSITEAAAAITAYRISNGYIVRTLDRSLMNTGAKAVPQFTYCKDAKGIAEHIIADSARQVLGVGSQYEMFGTTYNKVS
jgi:hypothetical protein